MNVFTHSTKDDNRPCTFVQFIRTEATFDQLYADGLIPSDWFDTTPEGSTIEDLELLAGQEYPKQKGCDFIGAVNVQTDTGPVRAEQWGRL